MSTSPVGNDVFSKLLSKQILAPYGSDLVIAEWTAQGTLRNAEPELIAPRHIHHQDDEAWYVLEGTLGFEIGNKLLEINAFGAVIAPRGVPHTFWNPMPTPARYIIIMTKQIYALVHAIHNTSQRDPETMKKLFEQYSSELL
jgi:mannose-6-phosphate isomerase-like protein (cupin superfamily)